MPCLWEKYEPLAQIPLTNLYEKLSKFVLVECFDIIDEWIVSKMQEAMEVLAMKIFNQSRPVNFRLFDEVARTVEICDKVEKLIFESALVSLLYVGAIQKVFTIFPFQFYDDVDSFCKVYVENGYSQFSSLDISEKKKLLCYANFMKIVVFLCKNPVGKRAHFMNIITGLCEGKGKKYKTGSGMSKATRCRVHIYQLEANVKPSIRPPRGTEIAKFLHECDISDAEAPDAILKHYTGVFPDQMVEMNNRSFDHHSFPGVTVETMEVTANGVNLLKTVSYSRASHDKEISHEISSSIQCVLLSDEDLSTASGFELVSSKNLDEDESYDELGPAKVVTMTRQSFHEEDNQIRAWLERDENYWMNDSSWMYKTSLTDCTFRINSSTLKNMRMDESFSAIDYHDARRAEDAENFNDLEFTNTYVNASTAIERNGNNLLSPSQSKKRKCEISAPQFGSDGPLKFVKCSFDRSS